MRKLLLLLCILSITVSAQAQLFGRHYDEGSYYDSVNVKHTGLISWSPPKKGLFAGKGDQIYFKPVKNAERLKLRNTQIQSFVIKTDSVTLDSFVVSANKDFAYSPFLRVLLNKPDVKIYCFAQSVSYGGGMSPGAGGMMMMGPTYSADKTDYYYGSNPNEVLKLTKKNFIEVMSKIMADKPEVVNKIKSKELRYSKLDDLLKFYKTGTLPGREIQADDIYN